MFVGVGRRLRLIISEHVLEWSTGSKEFNKDTSALTKSVFMIIRVSAIRSKHFALDRCLKKFDKRALQSYDRKTFAGVLIHPFNFPDGRKVSALKPGSEEMRKSLRPNRSAVASLQLGLDGIPIRHGHFARDTSI